MDQERIELLKTVIPDLKHCKLLGIEVHDIGKGFITLMLPYSESIIGNPETRVIHGGALTTLLDTACGFSAISSFTDPAIAPTLDLRIDYMRAAEPDKPVYGHAEVYRTTKNVLFSRGLAYQENRDKPVAHCAATFMRIDPTALEPGTLEARQRVYESVKAKQ
jgi:uncharacterized protein (TIGR00369 family)